MKINFLCNRVFDGWKPTDIRLGGTEESIVEWSHRLIELGHQVTVYDNDTRDSYKGGGDICINIKSADITPKEPTLYLTNETNAQDLDLSMYAGVIWPSEWAEEHIPVNNPRRFILPHGYDNTQIYPAKKITKQCLYASSPDRGLDTLLAVWPSVMRAHPDASLIVTYGATPQDIPGATFLGDVDTDTMNDLYRTSDYWCHPCSGGELYGMTGIKAQAASCIPVVIPTMALAETVTYGYFAEGVEDYEETLIFALSGAKNDRIREELLHTHYPNWKDSTDRLLEITRSVLQ